MSMNITNTLSRSSATTPTKMAALWQVDSMAKKTIEGHSSMSAMQHWRRSEKIVSDFDFSFSNYNKCQFCALVSQCVRVRCPWIIFGSRSGALLSVQMCSCAPNDHTNASHSDWLHTLIPYAVCTRACLEKLWEQHFTKQLRNDTFIDAFRVYSGAHIRSTSATRHMLHSSAYMLFSGV